MQPQFLPINHFAQLPANRCRPDWGSIENFDMFIRKIKDDEEHVAKLAIQQFGSIEKYTEEMKHNLEHFSEVMEDWYSQIPEEMRTEDKFVKLASHKGEDVASEPVQSIEQLRGRSLFLESNFHLLLRVQILFSIQISCS